MNSSFRTICHICTVRSNSVVRVDPYFTTHNGKLISLFVFPDVSKVTIGHF